MELNGDELKIIIDLIVETKLKLQAELHGEIKVIAADLIGINKFN